MGQTVWSSVELYLILFLFSLSILYFALYSFGYELVDFQNFSYSAMTIFKMMVGRFVGHYYRKVLEISLWKALAITLPIILVRTIFLTVFLGAVAYAYEHEVLNKDFSSNINIWNSIFFCNISLDKR